MANISGSMNRLADQVSADSGLLSTAQSQNIAGSRQTVRYGALLTLSDHERLRVFIHEFVVHGLIPWAEKTIRNLSEQVSKTTWHHHRQLLASRCPIIFSHVFSTASKTVLSLRFHYNVRGRIARIIDALQVCNALLLYF